MCICKLIVYFVLTGAIAAPHPFPHEEGEANLKTLATTKANTSISFDVSSFHSAKWGQTTKPETLQQREPDQSSEPLSQTLGVSAMARVMASGSLSAGTATSSTSPPSLPKPTFSDQTLSPPPGPSKTTQISQPLSSTTGFHITKPSPRTTCTRTNVPCYTCTHSIQPCVINSTLTLWESATSQMQTGPGHLGTGTPESPTSPLAATSITPLPTSSAGMEKSSTTCPHSMAHIVPGQMSSTSISLPSPTMSMVTVTTLASAATPQTTGPSRELKPTLSPCPINGSHNPDTKCAYKPTPRISGTTLPAPPTKTPHPTLDVKVPDMSILPYPYPHEASPTPSITLVHKDNSKVKPEISILPVDMNRGSKDCKGKLGRRYMREGEDCPDEKADENGGMWAGVEGRANITKRGSLGRLRWIIERVAPVVEVVV